MKSILKIRIYVNINFISPQVVGAGKARNGAEKIVQRRNRHVIIPLRIREREKEEWR